MRTDTRFEVGVGFNSPNRRLGRDVGRWSDSRQLRVETRSGRDLRRLRSPRSLGNRGWAPFDRGRLHLESALDAVNPSRQIRQNLPDRFQVTVRRIHGES